GEGGFGGRLQAKAEGLVRVGPGDEPPGEDPAAVLARIEQRASQADLPGALAELAKLPAPARAAAQAWIAKAQARLAAVAASRRFAAHAVAPLGTPPHAPPSPSSSICSLSALSRSAQCGLLTGQAMS